MATSLPAPASRVSEAQLLEAAKLLLASGVLGAAWRWWQARRKRRALERELIEAMAEQCRASADFDRFQVRYLIGLEQEASLEGDAREQYEQLKGRIRQTRARLWRARGFPDPEEAAGLELTSEQKAALLKLTQTTRWRMADSKPANPGDQA